MERTIRNLRQNKQNERIVSKPWSWALAAIAESVVHAHLSWSGMMSANSIHVGAGLHLRHAAISSQLRAL